MLLFGSGGHSKVVLDSLLAKNITVKGIFDDHPIADIHYGTQVLGPYSPDIFPQEPIIISIGRNFTRQQVASRISHTFGSITHPLASVSHSSQLGLDTVVFQLSIIQADTVVGNHVIINSGAIVEHDCSLGDFVHISPRATVCGGVIIGEGAWVGAGATIVPGVHVGKWSIIGAGSVVVNDIPDYSLVMGVPGVVVKKLKPSEL